MDFPDQDTSQDPAVERVISVSSHSTIRTLVPVVEVVVPGSNSKRAKAVMFEWIVVGEVGDAMGRSLISEGSAVKGGGVWEVAVAMMVEERSWEERDVQGERVCEVKTTADAADMVGIEAADGRSSVKIEKGDLQGSLAMSAEGRGRRSITKNP